MIPLSEPVMGDAEALAAHEAVLSGQVAHGPTIERFEQAFADLVGSPHAIACASGTAAIHLALASLAINRGVSVCVSDLSFVASANPITYLHAQPWFIDSERISGNLCPRMLADAFREQKPAAVIAVHLMGKPADLGPIAALCAEHQVPLIEDAAAALGSRYANHYPHASCAGKHVGTIGTFGCFSFNANKIITTGGGGMLTTSCPGLAAIARSLRNQGKDPDETGVHRSIGYNYRMSNIAAAIGVAQLERLADFQQRRQAIAARYHAYCMQRGDLSFCESIPATRPNHWLSCVRIPGRAPTVVEHLKRAGIQAKQMWLPISSQPCYAFAKRVGGMVAHGFAAEVVCLPSSPTLSTDDQQRVCDELSRALDDCRKWRTLCSSV